MALPQFAKGYSQLILRLKAPVDKATWELLWKLDKYAAQLARPDILPSERGSAEQKLTEAMKKLKVAMKAEIAKIKAEPPDESAEEESEDSKKPNAPRKPKAPTPYQAYALAVPERTRRSLIDQLGKLQKRASAFCQANGKGEAPKRLPTTDFAGDYARALGKLGLKHSADALAALKKLDSAQQAGDVTTLYKQAKAELEKTLPSLETEKNSAHAESKAQATAALAALSKLREEMKNYDKRVFLMSRLADR